MLNKGFKKQTRKAKISKFHGDIQARDKFHDSPFPFDWCHHQGTKVYDLLSLENLPYLCRASIKSRQLCFSMVITDVSADMHVLKPLNMTL